uniref:Non-ribosomal peptide synthetase n=1 Tax=Desertifilum tharense IPPAS B-1220 TaxID=1781255 RepID=A0ACD5GVY6_9CYAN
MASGRGFTDSVSLLEKATRRRVTRSSATHRPPQYRAFRPSEGPDSYFPSTPNKRTALKALSQQQAATLFMTLLAVFKVLLHRYSAQEDILVGSPIANRNRTEIEGLIGFFVNTLVLRTDLSGNPSFLELLQRLRQVTWEAYDRQDLPFEKLVEELQSDRDLSYSPFFQVKFMLEDASKLDLQLPGLNLEFLEPENPTAKLDLSLDFYETDSDLLGVFEYNTDLFEADTIARMVGHFQTLLTGILANPQQPLSQFPLLTPGEQQQILVEWNQTQTPYPEESFHQLFEAQVERTPDAIAVAFQNQHLTYRELNQRANQLAHYLQKQGVQPEVRVGICIERSLSMIIALLGVLKAGVLTFPSTRTYPADRLAFMLSDSQVPLLLTTESLVSQLPTTPPNLSVSIPTVPTIAQEKDCNPETRITPENLAYLIYTSGSTGTPKGVLVTHAGLGNLTADKIRTCQVKPHSRVLQFFSFGFDASIPEFVMSLGCGAYLHLATPAELSPSTRLSQAAARTVPLPILPSPLRPGGSFPDNFPALEMVLVGGEVPTAELIAQWSKGRLFINAYDPTETTVNASMVPDGDTLRPAANKQLYILDRYLQPVPVGVPGELYIGGVGLARGYLNRPEKTAEAFIANPFSQQPGSRLYKTGDLAYYRRDGQIKLLGRLDNQVKIRGFRIELGEVEALMLQHPDIRDCAVVVREAQPGDKRLCAYWVAEPGRNLAKGDLRRELEAKLPKYMVPAVFIQLEALPLNPNGKVDRQALPSPDFTRPELAGTYVAPRGPVEMQLAEIFAEVLQVERVGVNDDFFELGGHSLLATQLISRLLQRFAVELAVLDLFEAPTVAGLAQRLSGKSPAKLDNLLAFLQAEAVLDPSIIPPQNRANGDNPQAIFLTGATGFVGAFLLAELLQQTRAEVYCLVRAETAEAAQRQLQATLESYQIWQEGFKTRIIPVVGDLAKPRFGLSESEFSAMGDRLQVIYHGGAWVHHAYPYTLLKPTNVLGTQEVLRFACQGQAKPVHFLSATSVFSPTQTSGVQVIRETDSLADFPAPSAVTTKVSGWQKA